MRRREEGEGEREMRRRRKEREGEREREMRRREKMDEEEREREMRRREGKGKNATLQFISPAGTLQYYTLKGHARALQLHSGHHPYRC